MMLVVAMTLWVTLGGSIFRCLSADGAIDFRDRPCPHSGERVVIPASSTFGSGGLSEAERAALERLDERLGVDVDAARRHQSAERRRSVDRRTQRRQQCETAGQDLKALRAARRRGYALADSKALAAERLRLRRLRDENC